MKKQTITLILIAFLLTGSTGCVTHKTVFKTTKVSKKKFPNGKKKFQGCRQGKQL